MALQAPRAILDRWQSSRITRSVSSMIPGIVMQCPALLECASADAWTVEKVFPTLGDMTVVLISADESNSAILYLPGSKRAVVDFERRKHVMKELLDDPRLSDLWKLMPVLVGEGFHESRPYWITTRLPGVGLETTLQGGDAKSVLQLAADVLACLHERTSRKVTIGDELLHRWVFSPIDVILRSPLVHYARKSRLLLERLSKSIADALRGRSVVVSRVHGDFWPNNILVAWDQKQITGIVDWDLSRPDDLPALDIINFLLSSMRVIEGKELGQLIVETHARGAWETGMQEIWDAEIELLAGELPDLRNSLLIFWIRHLSANLEKSRWYSMNPLWAIKNYQLIMNYLETVPLR